MQLTIILEDKATKEVTTLANSIHNSLVGNQDYIDSNIVLNYETEKEIEEVTVFFSKDDCKNPEYIREQAKQIIDLFISNSGE